METLLRRLSQFRPSVLLLGFWICEALLAALATVRGLDGVATAVTLLLFGGYPYAVVLGMPEGIVRRPLIMWSRFCSALLLGCGALVAVVQPFLPETFQGLENSEAPWQWLGVGVGIAVNVAVFPGFFVGAAALNDTRRAMRQDPMLESIPNFLALYFWPFGGVLHVHRRVREVLNAV
jgi:hypothetical protein